MNIDSIRPTAAVALADKARGLELTGRKIIKLQTGDPDFDTHPLVVEAGYAALKKGLTHYSFSQGLPELREAIAADLNADLESEITKDWIQVTNGAAQGIFSVMAGLLEQDDEVIILEPNWPTVDSLATMMGAKVSKVSSLLSDEEIIDKLDQCYNNRVKLLCFNSPNNPTGMVFSQTLINRICEWAITKNIYILADEVYRYLQFNGHASSSLSFLGRYKRYVFADSFSKKFAMTGWRIGYIAADPEVLKKISKASQLSITNVAVFVQKAALEALTNEESVAYSEKMKEEYKMRCEKLTALCDSLGLEYLKPDGGFYLFIRINADDDVAFCDSLLEENDLCVVPGSAFGSSGKGYVRLSYANKLSLLEEGIRIIHKRMERK